MIEIAVENNPAQELTPHPFSKLVPAHPVLPRPSVTHKTDLISNHDRTESKHLMRRWNPTEPIHPSARGPLAPIVPQVPQLVCSYNERWPLEARNTAVTFFPNGMAAFGLHPVIGTSPLLAISHDIFKYSWAGETTSMETQTFYMNCHTGDIFLFRPKKWGQPGSQDPLYHQVALFCRGDGSTPSEDEDRSAVELLLSLLCRAKEALTSNRNSAPLVRLIDRMVTAISGPLSAPLKGPAICHLDSQHPGV